MESTNTERCMPLNLQFFAEGGQGEAQSTDTAATEAAKAAAAATVTATDPAKADSGKQAKQAEPPTPQTLTTLLEADKTLQSQFDKLVSKALATAQAKWEKEKSMTAEELAESKAREKAEELAEREKAIVARELRAKALGALGEKGLPAELVDAVSCGDEEGMTAHLSKVERAFRAAVDKAVAAKLAGSPPPAGNGQGAFDAFQQKIDKYRRT